MNELEMLAQAGLTDPAKVQAALKAKRDQDVLRSIMEMQQAGLNPTQMQALAHPVNPGAPTATDIAGGYGLLDPAVRMAGVNATYKLGRAGLAEDVNKDQWGRTMDMAKMAGSGFNIVSYLDALGQTGTSVPLNNPILQNIRPMMPTPAMPQDARLNDFLGDKPDAYAGGGMPMLGGPKLLVDASSGQIDATINENGGETLKERMGRVQVTPGKDRTLGAAQQNKILGQGQQLGLRVPGYALGGIVAPKGSKRSQEAAPNPYGKEAPGIYGQIGVGTNSDPNPNRPGLAQAKAGALDIAQRLRAGAPMFDYTGNWERAHAGMGTIPIDYAGRAPGTRGGVGGAPATRAPGAVGAPMTVPGGESMTPLLAPVMPRVPVDPSLMNAVGGPYSKPSLPPFVMPPGNPYTPVPTTPGPSLGDGYGVAYNPIWHTPVGDPSQPAPRVPYQDLMYALGGVEKGAPQAPQEPRAVTFANTNTASAAPAPAPAPVAAPSPVGGNDSQQAAAKLLASIGNNQLIEPEFVDTLRRGQIPGLGKINRRAFYSLPLEQQQALIGAWLSTNQASSGESITRQMDQNTPASLGG